MPSVHRLENNRRREGRGQAGNSQLALGTGVARNRWRFTEYSRTSGGRGWLTGDIYHDTNCCPPPHPHPATPPPQQSRAINLLTGVHVSWKIYPGSARSPVLTPACNMGHGEHDAARPATHGDRGAADGGRNVRGPEIPPQPASFFFFFLNLAYLSTLAVSCSYY